MPGEASARTAFVLAGGGSLSAARSACCASSSRPTEAWPATRQSRTARELGATRIVVPPGGFACAPVTPPSGAVASALHALNLMISRQMIGGIERAGDGVEIAVVPPLCPLDVSPYDFTRAGELIDRAPASTREWIETGVLSRREIPHQLKHHVHKQRPA